MLTQKESRMLLVILDGWGHGPDPSVSAIAQADTPVMDKIYATYPNAELTTYGLAVGLPEGQMGNSEVGHLNIGAGRIVDQELVRIGKAIQSGALHRNPVLLDAIHTANDRGAHIHLMGLVSDGGVHSHIDHLKALCEIMKAEAKVPTFIHAFTDGRDVDPHSGKGFIREVLDFIKDKDITLATVVGRYYAMDRDKRWQRTRLAYDALVHGTGVHATDMVEAVQESYDDGVTDEFIKPIVYTDPHGDVPGIMHDGDLMIFFNFRTDRPRQLVTVLSQKDLPEYEMSKLNLKVVTMAPYDHTFKGVQVLFTQEDLKQTIGEILSNAGKSQLRIAETEKYPHVTYFFSGGREQPFPGEERILIPSPKVATYDLQPEMSAPEVTEAVLKAIAEEHPDFICLNYANPDMVGHTGVFEATVKAVEVIDGCVGRLVAAALAQDYGIIIIADHGNADMMINPDGSPNTAHTKNPVPIIYVSKHPSKSIQGGILADVAPTILALLGIPQPEVMTGKNLLP